MNHYIEVVWNGVKTRVPVMGTIKTDLKELALAMCWCGRYVAEGRDPSLCGPGPDPYAQPKPDADAEYDRDVRGE